MSLHLGNLSSRVRRHELEQIFRRFGRCTVRMKEKFGFVVYECPENAETALGALRGTRICGERITLSWSNKQPQPPQYARRGRKNEQIQGQHLSKEDYANKYLGSDARSDHKRGFRKADDYPDLIDGAKAEYSREGYVGEKDPDFVQDIPGKTYRFEANTLENDRWGEPIVANSIENGLDFDRYEPQPDDDINLKQDNCYSTQLDCSLTERKPQEKPETDQVHQVATEHPSNSKPPESCQGCGELVQKMRKCPKQLNGQETRSSLRLLGDKDSLEARLTCSRIESDYQKKKRGSEEYKPSDKQQLKKARVPVSSSVHSDYSASGSQSPSRSAKSLSGSHPHLRSKSMALSSSPGSGSMSSHPRTKKHLSQQISRSSSPTALSLPVSLDQHLLSSPNKVQTNQSYLVSSSSHEFKEGSARVENGSSGAPIKPEDDGKECHSPRRDDGHAIMGNATEMKISCLPQSENRVQSPVTFVSKNQTDTREFENVSEDKLMQMKNPEIEASQRSIVASLMNISSKEMCMVLKTCSQKNPNEIEEDLQPDMYFGSGRLWPWEIVYYRRLKKGPISKENYARRLSQNQEFGIVDKYIRSSSGWGELTDENS